VVDDDEEDEEEVHFRVGKDRGKKILKKIKDMASGGKKKVRFSSFEFTVLQHRPCLVHVVRDKHVLHSS